MLKRFLDGMIFGAGFALAFILLWSAWIMWALPVIFESVGSKDRAEVMQSSPPEVSDEPRFLGSPASHSGKSLHKRNVLAEGPGVIEGRAVANGKPATGLKLRLALNNEVKSQWTMVDEEGRYTVSVPYGEYQVDGYELDDHSSDRILAGKIDLDGFFPSSFVFPVSETAKGVGLDFVFVDPVRPEAAKKQFSLSEDVIINWDAYPGAVEYRIQIRERPNPYSYSDTKELFDWEERPVVSEASVNLKTLGVQLKSDHYYTLEVQALDKDLDILSRSAWNSSRYDFQIE